MTRAWAAVMVAAVMAGCFAGSAAADDPAANEAQFRKTCGACHVAEPEATPRQGPNLWKVYGRPAGSLEGFKYSEALKASGLVWTEETLDLWLTNAGKLVPGTFMMMRQRDPEKRRKIIAYLKSLGAWEGAAQQTDAQ